MHTCNVYMRPSANTIKRLFGQEWQLFADRKLSNWARLNLLLILCFLFDSHVFALTVAFVLSTRSPVRLLWRMDVALRSCSEGVVCHAIMS